MKTNLLFAAAILSSVLLAPRAADACGGTFCDRGPQAMPVDQRGEDILFVKDADTVEAHIQIQYEGNARQFAWVIPVQALPTFKVGSSALFQTLKGLTVPTYGFQTRNDVCDDGANRGFSGGDAASSPTAGGTGGAGGASQGPTIVYKATVGAFDITVLNGGTVDEVVQWLDTNGYQQSDKAPPVLQKYLSKNYYFAAVKLTGGAGTNEIHPLVVTYRGDKPCVPLELTAIAATEDMVVRTFFLGSGRVYPLNYKHVVLNPLSLNWASLGSDYNQVVGRAVDSPVSDGHAFVTDFAGPTPQTGSFANGSWNAQALVGLTPAQALQTLKGQGLLNCYGEGSMSGQCQFNHPLLEGILDTYLPPPATVAAANYYACLSCVPGSLGKWDATKLAADVQDRIIDPAKHADLLLASNRFLTRMLTTISPVEMTEDPDFIATSDETPVIQTQQGSLRILCTQERVLTLPDGREVAYEADNTYPAFGGTMPAAERIEVVDASGKKTVLVDNRAAIDAKLAAHNKSRNWPATYESSKSDLEKLTGCAVGLGSGDAGGLALLALGGASLLRRRRR